MKLFCSTYFLWFALRDGILKCFINVLVTDKCILWLLCIYLRQEVSSQELIIWRKNKVLIYNAKAVCNLIKNFSIDLCVCVSMHDEPLYSVSPNALHCMFHFSAIGQEHPTFDWALSVTPVQIQTCSDSLCVVINATEMIHAHMKFSTVSVQLWLLGISEYGSPYCLKCTFVWIICEVWFW
jgi:hypothetical protein